MKKFAKGQITMFYDFFITIYLLNSIQIVSHVRIFKNYYVNLLKTCNINTFF